MTTSLSFQFTPDLTEEGLDGDIGKLDAGQMYKEILLFARLLHRLDEMPAALFKRIE